MSHVQVCVESVSEGYVAMAFKGSRLFCNTIPIESERRALGLLKAVCQRAWGRVPLKRTRFCGLESEWVAAEINKLFLGEPASLEGIKLVPPRDRRMRRALDVVSKVPRGRVITYSMLAKVLGTSPRVVGSYMAKNPYPLIVPCHRVVRADMTLGGYSFGKLIKAYILMREGVEVDLETGEVDRNALITREELEKLLMRVDLLRETIGW